MIFILKMHGTMIFFTIKMKIGNDFYYKKSIGNDFYYENGLEMIFTIKMHWKCL